MCQPTNNNNKRKRQDSTTSTGSGGSSNSSTQGTKFNDSKIRKIFMSSLPVRMLKQPLQDENPEKALTTLLAKQDVKIHMQPYDTLVEKKQFFQPVTEEEIDSYKNDVVTAVRNEDLDQLRALYTKGRKLKCSNKYGESLLHLACRRNMVNVTKLLVKEANVPFAVCDDYGRTPLHDACWTPEPNFELIDFILEDCPDLLYIKDKRGATALSYIKRDKWNAWNQYLQGKSIQFLLPRHAESSLLKNNVVEVKKEQ